MTATPYDLRAVIECVPNFSEGRDLAKVREIAAAIEATPSVLLLGWEADADHNRSVITFAGPLDAVVEAAVRGVGRAAELIDLREHRGEHPRVGAADVVPFVPLGPLSHDATSATPSPSPGCKPGVSGNDQRINETLADCARAAHQAGEEIWRRFGIPSYYYEAAALKPERTRLEKTRRKGFDGAPPDVGDISAHPTAGACMIGARRILIAYNVDLETKDQQVAQEIAKKVRESSGGFRHVKAMGLFLASRNCAQVSMNLTRYEEIPLVDLLRAIDEEAVRLGTRAGAGELIGMIPRKAFDMAPEFFQRAANFEEERIIEKRISRLLTQANGVG
jgi:glutamate formiminotransferase